MTNSVKLYEEQRECFTSDDLYWKLYDLEQDPFHINSIEHTTSDFQWCDDLELLLHMLSYCNVLLAVTHNDQYSLEQFSDRVSYEACSSLQKYEIHARRELDALKIITLIASGFDITLTPVQGDDPQQLLMVELLKKLHEQKRKCVMLIHEAESLSDKVLNILFTAIELQEDHSPVLHLILFGSEDLERRIRRCKKTENLQHILNLVSFNYQETVDHINKQLTSAGYEESNLFSKAELKKIHKLSKGNQNEIHRLAREVLIERIHGPLIFSHRRSKKPLIGAVSVLSLSLFGGALIYVLHTTDTAVVAKPISEYVVDIDEHNDSREFHRQLVKHSRIPIVPQLMIPIQLAENVISATDVTNAIHLKDFAEINRLFPQYNIIDPEKSNKTEKPFRIEDLPFTEMSYRPSNSAMEFPIKAKVFRTISVEQFPGSEKQFQSQQPDALPSYSDFSEVGNTPAVTEKNSVVVAGNNSEVKVKQTTAKPEEDNKVIGFGSNELREQKDEQIPAQKEQQAEIHSPIAGNSSTEESHGYGKSDELSHEKPLSNMNAVPDDQKFAQEPVHDKEQKSTKTPASSVAPKQEGSDQKFAPQPDHGSEQKSVESPATSASQQNMSRDQKFRQHPSQGSGQKPDQGTQDAGAISSSDISHTAPKSRTITSTEPQEAARKTVRGKSHRREQTVEKVQHFALQLIAVKTSIAAKRFISTNNLIGKVRIAKSTKNGVNWYVVVYGNYSTLTQAEQARVNLPASIAKFKPWSRSMRDTKMK